VDGVCVDSRGERLGDAILSTVFPNGFSTFQLTSGLENPTFVDLRPQVIISLLDSK
jgi:hypothetical protein